MGEGRCSLLLTAEAVYQGSLQQSHPYDDFAIRKENITAATISLPGKKLLTALAVSIREFRPSPILVKVRSEV